MVRQPTSLFSFQLLVISLLAAVFLCQCVADNPKKSSAIKTKASVIKEEAKTGKHDTLETMETITEVDSSEVKLDSIKVSQINPKAVVESKPKPKKRKKTKRRSKISFEMIRFDFDTIKQGESITHNFKFVNIGAGPLVIENVTATCGCTQPSYPFIPIEPGETGFIGVKYNSVGKEGAQKPLIKVKSNAAKEPVTLMLEGYVVKPPQEEVTDTLREKIDLDSLQQK